MSQRVVVFYYNGDGYDRSDATPEKYYIFSENQDGDELSEEEILDKLIDELKFNTITDDYFILPKDNDFSKWEIV